jgi:hypothetical protein
MKQIIVTALLIAALSTALPTSFVQACPNCNCGKSRITIVS